MGSTSIEIKARCPNPSQVRKILKAQGAVFKGLDRQRDTYFRIPFGRLKLREGNIENALIYYQRTNQKKSKQCDSILSKFKDAEALKKLLSASLGILTLVDKKREIYFINNTKFHIDRVRKLGSFVEIEVFGRPGREEPWKLTKQCEQYQRLLGIRPRDLLADSYSDQLLQLKDTNWKRMKDFG